MPSRVVAQAGELRSARLESLRAIAALAVLVGHSYGWSHSYRSDEIYGTFHARLLLGGGLGVYLFFCLTGYLLFLPFARLALGDRSRHVSLRRYAANRALRVLPLYYVVIVTYLLVRGRGLRHDWWRFATLTESFWNDTVAQVDGPVWSLVVEVQFYVLLPLVGLALGRVAGRSLGRASALVGGLGVVLLAVRLATITHHHPTPVWRYSLPANAVFFVPGILLALIRARCDLDRPAWTRHRVLARSELWVAAAVGLFLLVADNYAHDALLLPSSFLLVGACALPLADDRAVAWLDWRPLSLLGVASYSLYLWHEPVVHALSTSTSALHSFVPLTLVAGAGSIAIAAASYRLVEAPFLRLRRQWQPPGTAPVAHEDAAPAATVRAPT